MWENLFSDIGSSTASSATIDTFSLPDFASGLDGSFSTDVLSGVEFDPQQFNDLWGQGAITSMPSVFNTQAQNIAAQPGFLNSFGDEVSSIFGNMKDIAGSDAFKNLSSLGINAAQFAQSKKQLKKSNKIQDERQAAFREDRAYNKKRRTTTAALRF